MNWKRVLAYAALGALLFAGAPWLANGAQVMWEEDLRMICHETGENRLPKRMTVRQVIDNPFFATALNTNVGVFASYLFRFDVSSGKVVVTGVVLKADGSEHALPRVAGRMKNGDAEKVKSTDLVFEPGDVIEWKVKLKGLAPLAGFDCWSLEVGIVATDSAFVQSNMLSLSTLSRSRK